MTIYFEGTKSNFAFGKIQVVASIQINSLNGVALAMALAVW